MYITLIKNNLPLSRIVCKSVQRRSISETTVGGLVEDMTNLHLRWQSEPERKILREICTSYIGLTLPELSAKRLELTRKEVQGKVVVSPEMDTKHMYVLTSLMWYRATPNYCTPCKTTRKRFGI